MIALTETERLARANARRPQQPQQQQATQTAAMSSVPPPPPRQPGSASAATGAELIVRAMAQVDSHACPEYVLGLDQGSQQFSSSGSN